MKENRRGWGAATGGSIGIKKGPNNYFKPGDWNMLCDECAQPIKGSQSFERWDNCRVCSRCIEIRNPQDYVRGVPDHMTPPFTRPRPPPVFASGNSTTVGNNTTGQSTMTNGSMTNGVMTG